MLCTNPALFVSWNHGWTVLLKMMKYVSRGTRQLGLIVTDMAVGLLFISIICLRVVLYSGSPDFEFLMLSLTSPRTTVINPDFYIALFYRPPSSNISLLDTLFSTLCNLNPSIFVNTCIIGDFNIDFLSPPNFLYNKLLSVMSSFNLSQVISEPTRVVNDCSSLIDLAFVSVPGTVQLCETIPPLGNSDHLGIHLIMSTKLKMNSQKSQLRNIWRYNLADFDQAMELLDSMEWETLLDDNDVDVYWSSFKHYFLQIMEICIPHAMVKTKKNVPWLNKEVIQAIRKRNLLYRRAKNSNTAVNQAKYRTMRNKVVCILRESKQRYFDKLNQADKNEFWKIMKQCNNNSSTIPTLQTTSGATAHSSLDKANVLNKFFYDCFNHSCPPLTECSHNFEREMPPEDCPEQLLTTVSSIHNLLVHLDSTKSTGCDGISAKMLKQTADSTALIVSKLVNLSISRGKFPSEWKVARVVPIPKPGLCTCSNVSIYL